MSLDVNSVQRDQHRGWLRDEAAWRRFLERACPLVVILPVECLGIFEIDAQVGTSVLEETSSSANI